MHFRDNTGTSLGPISIPLEIQVTKGASALLPYRGFFSPPAPSGDFHGDLREEAFFGREPAEHLEVVVIVRDREVIERWNLYHSALPGRP